MVSVPAHTAKPCKYSAQPIEAIRYIDAVQISMGTEWCWIPAQYQSTETLYQFIALRRVLGRWHAISVLSRPHRQRLMLHLHDGHLCLAW